MTKVYPNLPMMLVLSTFIVITFIMAQMVSSYWLLQIFVYEYGTVTSLSAMVTLFVIFAMIWLLIKINKANFGEFMAIRPFRWRYLFIFSILLLLLNLIIDGVTTWLDREPMQFMDALILTANPLWLLILTVIVIVPIYEELIFRGFMWSGLVGTKLGVWGTAILTSVVFVVIHVQYGWVELLGIFALAMLFSYARLLSGSLLLPIILHIFNNGLAMWEYLTFG